MVLDVHLCNPIVAYSKVTPLKVALHPIPMHKFTRPEWTRGLCASSKAALRLLWSLDVDNVESWTDLFPAQLQWFETAVNLVFSLLEMLNWNWEEGEVYLTWFRNSRQTTLNKASIETRALRNFHLGRLAGEEDKIKAKPDVLQLVGALPDRRGRLFPHLFTFPGLLYALEELLGSAHVQNS